MKVILQVATVGLWSALAAGAGCAAEGAGGLYGRFQHEDPAVRIAAAIEAAKRRDTGATPYLVDRLSDSETDVRFFSMLALREITGETMGYHTCSSRAERAAAEKRWRAWLRARARRAGAPRSGKTSGE